MDISDKLKEMLEAFGQGLEDIGGNPYPNYMQSLKSVLRPVPGVTQDFEKEVIEFLKKNQSPSEQDVHEFAARIGVPTPAVRRVLYRLASSFLSVGKHRHVPDSEYDAHQLAMGQKVELEHTDDPAVAKEIAKDHLAECPDYYTRLEIMEKECEK